MTASELAAVLDPQHEVAGWWVFRCAECGGAIYGKSDFRHWDYCKDNPAPVWKYTGPPDLHTAREHDWRKEDYLEARMYSWHRYPPMTFVRDVDDNEVSRDTNHSAALLEAVEKVRGSKC